MNYEEARRAAEINTSLTGELYLVEVIYGPNGEGFPEYRAVRAKDIPGYIG